MITALSITAIVLSIIAIIGIFILFNVSYQADRNISKVVRLYQNMEHDFKPLRLNFLLNLYNECVSKEEYREASKMLDIIKKEFPEDYELFTTFKK